MKLSLKNLKSLISEVIDNDDNDLDESELYDLEERAMINVSEEEYYGVYRQLRGKLKVHASRTNVTPRDDDPEYVMYTLWGIKVNGVDRPVCSSLRRFGKWTFRANKDFL